MVLTDHPDESVVKIAGPGKVEQFVTLEALEAANRTIFELRNRLTKVDDDRALFHCERNVAREELEKRMAEIQSLQKDRKALEKRIELLDREAAHAGKQWAQHEAESRRLAQELADLRTKAPAPIPSDESVLEEAQRIVNGVRQAAYGPPERNFETIAALWNTYLGVMPEGSLLLPRDVAMLMVLMKVARDVSGQPKRDNLTDICGYAACADLIGRKAS